MSEAISKAKLLEWLQVGIDWGCPYAEVRREIESGSFDLSPTDVDVKEIEDLIDWLERALGTPKRAEQIRQLLTKLSEYESQIGELDTAHQMMHARNERLEEEQRATARELIEYQNVIGKLRKELDEKEAEVERLRGALAGSAAIANQTGAEMRELREKLKRIDGQRMDAEAEVERLRGGMEDLFQNREKWREDHMSLTEKLNQAVEVLEWIEECGSDIACIRKARNTLQAIRGVNA